jgi:hypothetical protein
VGRLLSALALAAFAATNAHADFTRDTTAEPHPGIRVEEWSDDAIPARVHLAIVALGSSEISLFATAEADKGLTPTAFAAAVGAQLAVNGDFFAAATFLPRGLAVGDMVAWGETADDTVSGVIQLDRTFEDRAAVTIRPPELVIDAGALPSSNQGVVSGRPLLIRAGVVQGPVCDDAETLACVRAPRTAVGVSADGNTLYLAVVDGWQVGSAGLTANELAGFLALRGARDALGTGVGSAAAMILDGEPVSSPSDGVVRPVANHLAVRYGALPPGQLIGVICLRDIFDCTTKIEGATVTLDDGSVDVSNENGIYDFPEVAPRFACVDVEADGYEPAHKCTQVESSMENYNSVALFPLGEQPDAGPRPDASTNPATPDAEGGGGGGGGCNVGAANSATLAIALLIALGRARRSRRRA